jgi:hypothetical protein
LLQVGAADITRAGHPAERFHLPRKPASVGVDDPPSVRAGPELVGGSGADQLRSAGHLCPLERQRDRSGAWARIFENERRPDGDSHPQRPTHQPVAGEGEPDAAYWQMLCERSVQAPVAVQSLRPASLHAASYRIPGHTVNRRALLADGRVSMALEPDGLVMERGPVDDTLTVLLFRDPAGRAIAAVLHLPATARVARWWRLGARGALNC